MIGIPSELNLFRRKRLPVLLGAEAAECGLVSMTMVARYFGHEVDLNGMRQRFSLSIAGASLRALMGFADQIGFTTRALRVELEALVKVRTPCILHWDLNHFVVLAKASSTRIVIHDPAVGRRALSIEEASKHFTGVVLEVQPSSDFKPITAKLPTRLTALWAGMTGFWGAFFQILTLSIGLQLTVFAAPFQLQLVVDEALARGDGELLTVLAIGFGALVVLRTFIEALRGYALQVLGQLLSFQMIGNLVRHLLRLKAEFFEKRHIGDILSRIQSSQPIQQAITQGVVASLIDGAMAMLALIVLFWYSAQLAAIVLAAVILSLIVTFSFYPIMRRRSEERIMATAKEQSHLIESVRAAKTIKLMGRETERESQWRNLFAEVTNAGFSLGKFQITQNALQSGITGLQTIVIIYVAGRMILAAEGFSVGMLFAFLSFRQTFSDRALALINQAFEFRLLNLHLERIGDLIHAEPDVNDTESEAVHDFQGEISIKGIGFRYGASDPLVLDDVSLDIKSGEFLAITGPSGGGKTTFLKLLLGLYQPDYGVIELDGHRATAGQWRAWRTHIGLVAQDDQLLSGTLADNIAFFNPDLDMQRVVDAAVAAHVHDDIARMPMQYLSLVGDMGSTLSGGQRQRVLLARALYRNPKILILDEGTANLDTETEAQIADLVARLPITRIVVAHRPALIGRADRVVRVVDQSVVEHLSVPSPLDTATK
jgi:ATP-binding cassette subfamily B protein RaxB